MVKSRIMVRELSMEDDAIPCGDLPLLAGF
jgi:hypothetical protein